MLSVGIVGLPNVGKSSLFSILTGTHVASENYPFCTISPNMGVATVKDKRLTRISNIAKSKKVVHTGVKFTDVAGLVKGASNGTGLGNKFLSDIRETQAIVHVVRCFEDKDISHVSGEINPEEDISIINNEIILSDISLIENIISKFARKTKTSETPKIRNTLNKVVELLYSDIPARNMDLTEDENKILEEYRLLSAKPMIYVANYGDIKRDSFLLEKAKNYLKRYKEELMEIHVSGDSSENSNALDTLIYASYKSLDLLTFFTAGEKEARAWTIKSGLNAENAASIIHTDIKKGFIRAEVTSYVDYIKQTETISPKKSKKMRLEGRKYVMQDGDVVLFRFNV